MYKIMYRTQSMRCHLSAVDYDEKANRLTEALFEVREKAEQMATKWFGPYVSDEIDPIISYYVKEVLV